MLDQDINEKLKPGMEVRVFEKIKEKEKSRIARFTGVVLAIKHGRGKTGTITIRNSGLAGVGVEKVLPLHSPLIDKIEILRVPKKIRRAKLYYLRDTSRKKMRQKLGLKEPEKTGS